MSTNINNKETKKKPAGGGCLGCCAANAKPPKATRRGSRGPEVEQQKNAAGAIGGPEGKNAEARAAS